MISSAITDVLFTVISCKNTYFLSINGATFAFTVLFLAQFGLRLNLWLAEYGLIIIIILLACILLIQYLIVFVRLIIWLQASWIEYESLPARSVNICFIGWWLGIVHTCKDVLWIILAIRYVKLLILSWSLWVRVYNARDFLGSVLFRYCFGSSWLHCSVWLLNYKWIYGSTGSSIAQWCIVLVGSFGFRYLTIRLIFWCGVRYLWISGSLRRWPIISIANPTSSSASIGPTASFPQVRKHWTHLTWWPSWQASTITWQPPTIRNTYTCLSHLIIQRFLSVTISIFASFPAVMIRLIIIFWQRKLVLPGWGHVQLITLSWIISASAPCPEANASGSTSISNSVFLFSVHNLSSRISGVHIVD